MTPSTPTGFSIKRILGWTGFTILLGAIFFLRRWDQFFAPNVYAEDGMIALPDALTLGWGALFDPVQGYLTLTTRFFASLALVPEGLSGYPFWGSAFGAFFGVFVLVYIAATPSLLPRSLWFALAAALVPTGPEVFCLPYMAFWWAGLLLMALVLRANHDRRGLLISDLVLAGFCGLSGVIAPLAAGVLAVRLFFFRDRFFGGIRLLMVLAAVAFVQVMVFLFNGKGTAGDTSIGKIISDYGAEPFQTISRFIRQFFGEFLFQNVSDGVWPQSLLALAGLLLIGFLVIAGWRTRNPLFLYLWMFLAGSLILAVVRVDFVLMHPIHAGPRYFFYPWVLLSWMLIAIFILSPGVCTRALCAVCLILASVGLFRGVPDSPADDLNWKAAVERLHENGFERLPVHSNGRAGTSWEMPMFYRGGEYSREGD